MKGFGQRVLGVQRQRERDSAAPANKILEKATTTPPKDPDVDPEPLSPLHGRAVNLSRKDTVPESLDVLPSPSGGSIDWERYREGYHSGTYPFKRKRKRSFWRRLGFNQDKDDGLFKNERAHGFHEIPGEEYRKRTFNRNSRRHSSDRAKDYSVVPGEEGLNRELFRIGQDVDISPWSSKVPSLRSTRAIYGDGLSRNSVESYTSEESRLPPEVRSPFDPISDGSKIRSPFDRMLNVSKSSQHAYANTETMLGDPIENIPRNLFYVTEDNYAWAMDELVQAITANNGVFRNPLSKAMFTHTDIAGILKHPLGKSLSDLQLRQLDWRKSINPKTIQRLGALAYILQDRPGPESDESEEQYRAINGFEFYSANLSGVEGEAINKLSVPITDSASGQSFDTTIGDTVRDAKANKICFGKAGEILEQAAEHLRKESGNSSPSLGSTVGIDDLLESQSPQVIPAHQSQSLPGQEKGKKPEREAGDGIHDSWSHGSTRDWKQEQLNARPSEERYDWPKHGVQIDNDSSPNDDSSGLDPGSLIKIRTLHHPDRATEAKIAAAISVLPGKVQWFRQLLCFIIVLDAELSASSEEQSPSLQEKVKRTDAVISEIIETVKSWRDNGIRETEALWDDKEWKVIQEIISRVEDIKHVAVDSGPENAIGHPSGEIFPAYQGLSGVPNEPWITGQVGIRETKVHGRMPCHSIENDSVPMEAETPTKLFLNGVDIDQLLGNIERTSSVVTQVLALLEELRPKQALLNIYYGESASTQTVLKTLYSVVWRTRTLDRYTLSLLGSGTSKLHDICDSIESELQELCSRGQSPASEKSTVLHSYAWRVMHQFWRLWTPEKVEDALTGHTTPGVFDMWSDQYLAELYSQLQEHRQAFELLIDSQPAPNSEPGPKSLLGPSNSDGFCDDELGLQLAKSAEYSSLVYSYLSGMYYTLKRSTRPSVPRGHSRIEWKCGCGEPMYADFRTTNTHALRQIKACLENAASTFTPLQGTSNNSTMIGSHSVTSSQQSGQQPTNAMSSGSPGQLQRTTSSTTPGVSAMGNSQSQDTIAINPWRNNRSFFELCVNMNPLNIRLGEISLNKTASSGCSTEIKTDALFFKEVYEAYFLIRSKRWFLSYLYKPIDIAFVRFHVSDRHRVGIFRDKKLAVPPVGEVSAGRYHYYECPLEPEEPIDHRTFLHYFWKHESHHNDPCDFWLNRMPKKLHESILKQSAATGPQMGWGVHIIEGPNKPVIACIFAFFVILSFLVSVICAIVMKTQESGFGIGQWMVAALSAMATAFYFHLTES